jgi:hypothetical protein
MDLGLALAWLVDWYRRWQGSSTTSGPSATDMQTFTLEQIRSYVRLVPR